MEVDFTKECRIVQCRYPRKFAPEQYAQLIKRGILFKFAYPIVYSVLHVANIVYKLFCRRKHILREQYDLAIAFSGHFNDLTFVKYGFVRARKKMCWLHGSIMDYALISDGFLNLYQKIQNLVVLSDDYQGEVLLRNRQLKLNIHKIYNPSFISERKIDWAMVEKLQQQYGKFLLMVGRLAPDKDQRMLIRALEYLIGTYRFSEKLLLVGDGSMRDELEQYVNEHGLADQVIFAGNCDDVQNYYKAAYLFVHSSPAEGLPTTLIEALFYRLPIVSTDSRPGVPEILQKGKYGKIVPVGDWKSFGEAVYLMYKNEEVYQQMKNVGAERAQAFLPIQIKMELEKMIASIFEDIDNTVIAKS